MKAFLEECGKKCCCSIREKQNLKETEQTAAAAGYSSAKHTNTNSHSKTADTRETDIESPISITYLEVNEPSQMLSRSFAHKGSQVIDGFVYASHQMHELMGHENFEEMHNMLEKWNDQSLETVQVQSVSDTPIEKRSKRGKKQMKYRNYLRIKNASFLKKKGGSIQNQESAVSSEQSAGDYSSVGINVSVIQS